MRQLITGSYILVIYPLNIHQYFRIFLVCLHTLFELSWKFYLERGTHVFSVTQTDSNDLLARVAREFVLILFYPIQADFYIKINHYRKSLNTLLPVVMGSSLPHALPAILNH